MEERPGCLGLHRAQWLAFSFCLTAHAGQATHWPLGWPLPSVSAETGTWQQGSEGGTQWPPTLLCPALLLPLRRPSPSSSPAFRRPADLHWQGRVGTGDRSREIHHPSSHGSSEPEQQAQLHPRPPPNVKWRPELQSSIHAFSLKRHSRKRERSLPAHPSLHIILFQSPLSLPEMMLF